MLSEELTAALDERVGRDELRKAGLVTGLLKALERTIQSSKGELSPRGMKTAKGALRAGQTLLAAYLKQQWPKGRVPEMDIRGPRAGKGGSEIRRLLAALDDALDKLGDPGNRGYDDVVDVKIDQAEDELVVKPADARIPRG